jgi:hypothetical protein
MLGRKDFKKFLIISRKDFRDVCSVMFLQLRILLEELERLHKESDSEIAKVIWNFIISLS